VSELLRFSARNPSHPMTAFLPLFVDRDQESGLTLAEMYLEHVFPHYTCSNTDQALQGSGVAFPPIDGRLMDPNIARLITTGYLTAPGQPPAPPREAEPGPGPARLCRPGSFRTGTRSKSPRRPATARSRSART
jgi:hypothetical protein